MAVALRVPKSKGARLTRRFRSSDALSRVFEWADAEAELEQGTLKLTPAGGEGLSLEKDGDRELGGLGLGGSVLMEAGAL